MRRLASGGTIRSTYLAPNAVLDLISASTLLGRYWNGSESIFKCKDARLESLPMELTSPIWTPRNFTLAPFSMTRPALSETKVSGTLSRSVPENSRTVIVDSATITRSSTGAHQIGSIFPAPGRVVHPRHPERWKLPDCPYTDSVMVSRMKTPAVMDVRTARPTASPTPAGPPVAVYP